jgi:5-hydroxyisourate hydrolase
MRSLSTHVLDAVSGSPARGIAVTLARHSTSTPGGWAESGTALTDDDGRVRDLAPDGLEPGVYRLAFATGAYFAATGQAGFYPEVAVSFTVADERHYHVPLLLSPYAFSTYRGS